MLVLGIDPARTEAKPSGVALLAWRAGARPCLVALARSYGEFLTIRPRCPLAWGEGGETSAPDPVRLLARAGEMTGDAVGLVSLDLPLSPLPASGRRPADEALAQAYGEKAVLHCAEAMGPWSETVLAAWRGPGLARAGVDRPARLADGPLFLETCADAAVMALLGLAERLPYRVARIRSYWRGWSPPERWARLTGNMEVLRAGLAEKIEGLAGLLPPSASLLGRTYPKRVLAEYENLLDALLCAWAGCEYLAGRARPYGDADAVIWVPEPGTG